MGRGGVEGAAYTRVDRVSQSDVVPGAGSADLEQLRQRLGLVSRITFGEVSEALDESAKNLARSIVGRLLGVTADQLRSRPYGTVRTIPVRPDRKPREPTKISGIDYTALCAQSFLESSVARQLTAVLLVPVIKESVADAASWYITDPFVWVPDASVWEVLARDYEETRTLVRASRAEELSTSLTTGQGTHMTPKTSGRSGLQNTYMADDGRTVRAKDRAFFLRTTLTRDLLADRVDLGDHRAVVDRPVAPTSSPEELRPENVQLLLDILSV